VLAVEGYLSDGTFVRFEEENPFETLESLPKGKSFTWDLCEYIGGFVQFRKSDKYSA
jgi:hypothetical protein